MVGLRRPAAALVVGLLVVCAGCSIPFVGGGQAGNGTPAAGGPSTQAPTGSGATGTGGPSGSGTPATPTDATATPTRSPFPTPTVYSETGIRVVEIQADGGVFDEYVVLKNTADAPLDMSGWRVKDEDGHVYTFPDDYRLDVGETLTLHSSRGTQTQTERFWWADDEVWDDDGDTVAIFDERGQRVYERTYS